ncbi:MAG: methylated-DNA--[protein]-cysteine S-methyltransferase [Pseudomonadales bacterium]|nr:methylated-DNA--[protein]-cysteine S-methyltransferase [Pseudomonadales bacterium]MBO6594290.1 methylated-DNA--[protein]-cysteine S-methyltransferase [Pseudomonadales bacterium]MBO6658598.1 methylated-DNA--[protein]-cysteine S-methyltransferase [Pseudomonadales bacterium]MBO6822149.1 methylated-DNA--[protein]-cysteine S-methyltransferase [Pseudomonadales bacterium]
MAETQEAAKHRVFQVVSQIPHGKVASYGQIARLAEMPSHARLVGRILSQLPLNTQLPWHRVVNAQGEITNPGRTRQAKRLTDEGVTLINGRVSLKLYGWEL